MRAVLRRVRHELDTRSRKSCENAEVQKIMNAYSKKIMLKTRLYRLEICKNTKESNKGKKPLKGSSTFKKETSTSHRGVGRFLKYGGPG